MRAEELVAAGGTLDPSDLLAAYARGLFPMPIDYGADERLGWWCPDPRGVIDVDSFGVNRSMNRAARKYEIRVDTACAEVIDGCADPSRPGAWINPAFRAAYLKLHALGYVHSIEAWHANELCGGLYGVGLGGLFAAESKFHRTTDASKAAVIGLIDICRNAGPGRLIDVQWQTEHLASIGVVELDAGDYLDRLPTLLGLPEVDWSAASAPGI